MSDEHPRTQMFFNINVLRNFPIFTGTHLHWSLFLTGVFLWILRNSYEQLFFYRTPPVASVDLLLIKNNVGWFLLQRFLDRFRVRYLHIISRNHSNKLLFQQSAEKTCPKLSTAAKAICSDNRILTA